MRLTFRCLAALSSLLLNACASTLPPEKATYAFDRRCQPAAMEMRRIPVGPLERPASLRATAERDEAIKLYSSDVHVQPTENTVEVRMRIDGVLFDRFSLPKRLQDEILSRIKIMGHMNIAEKRLAQDGRATVNVGERTIDLRISSVPASYGERLVVRLLDKSAKLYTLPEIGMESAMLSVFRELISLEHGLILVTGPTGSGKSTTLYAALREINSREWNIITLEDPIEYKLEGISQIQVSDKKGMTFSGGLRNVLRQDPDIIMVGEIRDRETAAMAIQSALTGHLVFSTLHTNDAASAVTRLLDLGIEPYLVSSSLVAVLAQRLVRRVCDGCTAPYTPSEQELRRLLLAEPEIPSGALHRGVGCDRCYRTGYKSRIGIFELLVLNDSQRQLIQERQTAAEIRKNAMTCGMRVLREDGIHKVISGITTFEEVARVT